MSCCGDASILNHTLSRRFIDTLVDARVGHQDSFWEQGAIALGGALVLPLVAAVDVVVRLAALVVTTISGLLLFFPNLAYEYSEGKPLAEGWMPCDAKDHFVQTINHLGVGTVGALSCFVPGGVEWASNFFFEKKKEKDTKNLELPNEVTEAADINCIDLGTTFSLTEDSFLEVMNRMSDVGSVLNSSFEKKIEEENSDVLTSTQESSDIEFKGKTSEEVELQFVASEKEKETKNLELPNEVTEAADINCIDLGTTFGLTEDSFLEVMNRMSDVGSVLNCSSVCKGWNRRFADELAPLYRMRTIARKDWEKGFPNGVIDEDGDGRLSSLPRTLLKEISVPCHAFPEKGMVADSHMLVWRPKSINGQNLTSKTLGQLVKAHYFPDTDAGYLYIWSKVADALDQSIDASYWFLMTTDVLPETRNKSRKEHKMRVAGLAEKSGEQYILPSGSEAIIGIFASYFKYNERLFSNAYTILSDKKVQGFRFYVGGFAPAGLHVRSYYDRGNIGVAALRKFRSLVLG